MIKVRFWLTLGSDASVCRFLSVPTEKLYSRLFFVAVEGGFIVGGYVETLGPDFDILILRDCGRTCAWDRVGGFFFLVSIDDYLFKQLNFYFV